MFEEQVASAADKLEEAAKERGYDSWSEFAQANFTMETRRLWETIVFGKPDPFGSDEKEEEEDG